MAASFSSDPVIASSRSPISAGLVVVLGTALMVAAPMAMGVAAMQGSREGRSTVPVTMASANGAAAIDNIRSTAAVALSGESRATSTASKRSTAPTNLW
jgi:hypothetical protein